MLSKTSKTFFLLKKEISRGLSIGMFKWIGPGKEDICFSVIRTKFKISLSSVSWSPFRFVFKTFLQTELKKSSWFTVWLAPQSFNLKGLSAVRNIIPLQDRSASTAAGNKLLTAVPEVVITKERLPEAAEIPREWNPADLSSIELKIFISPNLFNSPAAIAKGADLLPGHSIKFWTPIFIRRFKSC